MTQPIARQPDAAAPGSGRDGRALSSLFRCNPLPMWIYDLESLAFLAVNDAAIEHYGYSQDELLAMTITDIRPSQDQPAMRANVAAVDDRLDLAGLQCHLKKDGSLIHVEITAHPLDYAGRRAELVLAHDVTQRVQAERELRHRAALEATIADISARFVAPADLDAALDYCLAAMGRFSDASRAYLFQFDEAAATMDNTHEWCAAGVTPERGRLQGLPFGQFPWLVSRLRRGEVVPIPNVGALPAEAAAERYILEQQAIRSLILVPIRVGGPIAGCIGLDNVRAPEPWRETDLTLLRVIAEVIGAALLSERQASALRASDATLASFLHNAQGFAVYRVAVDPDAPEGLRVELASPSIREILGVMPEAPLTAWFERIHPDDRSLAREANERAVHYAQPFDVTVRVRHPREKAWHWIRAVSNPVRDDSGRLTHFNGLIVDVSDSIRATMALKAERDFAAAVMDTVGALVVVMDREGRIVRFNRACEQATGYSFAEARGRRVWDFLLSPEERAAVLKVFSTFRAGQFPNHFENYWVARDGTRRLIAWSNTALLDDRGQLTYAIGTGIDITERKQTELALRKLSSAVEQSASGIAIIDRSGEVEYVNPRFAQIVGCAASALIGAPARLFGSPDVTEGPQRDIWQALACGEDWRGELRDRRGDGEWYWAMVVLSPLRSHSGEVTHYVAVVEDATELKEAREELERLASYDALTGLPNRRLFRDRLQQALRVAQRHDQALAVLYLDLDNFKRVNDSLGHDAGDALLKTVADRLRECVRIEDTVARLGGDEFVLLLAEPHSGSIAADVVARKVLETLRTPVRLTGQDVVVTASIGITVAPEDSSDPAALMRNADLAMYRAKEGGRDRHEFFRAEMNSEVWRRLRLEAELRQALAGEELVLHYQPIVRLPDMSIVGLEALARWHHPQRGLVYPDQFIPLAEETGLIVPIGEYLLCRAGKDLAELREQGVADGLYVSVNLSARQVRDQGLADRIEELLRRAGLPASALVLELTESLLMHDLAHSSGLLERLRELGVRISVDDFGTGYSSLSYLKQLPLDHLKVDRSFVRDIPQDRSDMAIAAAVIAMAHKLGLSVVAEGVETVAQLDFLRDNGCDLAQGFLLGRPLPAHELPGLLAAGKVHMAPVARRQP